jgi:hypothetical protein
VSDRRPQTVFWYLEVFKSATNKNAGGMNRSVEGFFTIDEQHAQAVFAEEPGALKPGKAGANNDYVIMFHWFELKNLVGYRAWELLQR